MAITLTDAAVARAQQFLSSEPDALGLRFGVRKVGCSGWAYQVEVARDSSDTDQVFSAAGVRVYVDAKSLPVVDGTEIDFQRSNLSSNFVFNNPKQTAACGCGESFSVDIAAI